MTSIARFSYTQPCTFWPVTARDERYGQITYGPPVTIMCDYGFDGDLTADAVGNEIVQKNTFWTEFVGAKIGDYIIIGIFTETNPQDVNAEEIKKVINFGNTFNRAEPPDFALITG